MRIAIFRTGWTLLFVLPIAYMVQIVVAQDLPDVQPWKWSILGMAVLMIYLARDRDDVLKHHVA